MTLNRASVPAALKKAGELISDGCWNVEIVTPDGATYHPGEFDQLRERAGAADPEWVADRAVAPPFDQPYERPYAAARRPLGTLRSSSAAPKITPPG